MKPTPLAGSRRPAGAHAAVLSWRRVARLIANVRWKKKEYKTTNDKGAVAGDAACGQTGVANHEPA